MPVVSLKSFGGIAPKVPPRYLKQEQAQTALNCPVFAGSIQPILDMGDTLLTFEKSDTIKSIYRFGQDNISDVEHWFHWNNEVDVCRSQIAGDTAEWTFFTGDGTPKATNSEIGLASTNLPSNYRELGLAGPTAAATAAVLGDEDDTETQETRVYTYTFVNKAAGREVESAPAGASNNVDVRTSQRVKLTGLQTTAPTGYIATHKRIYRATAGVFLLVDEIAIANDEYEDTISPDSLQEELPSLYWSTPPAELEGLINLPNGMMAGFVGRDLYFCEPYRPHAWPENYIQTLDYPIVGLGRMDTTLAVLTTGNPYFVQGSHPSNMAVVKSDLEQACVSKESIVSAGGGVIYAAPDGLMLLSPGGSSIITDGYFNFRMWQQYFKPDSIHAYQQDNQYIAFYDNGTTKGGFIFDISSRQFILHDMYATAGFQDLQRDKLFLCLENRKLVVWQGGLPKSYIWRSKKFSMPTEISFACGQLESEAYPMTLKFYADGTLLHTQTVESRNPFRLPCKRARDWEVQVEGSKEVFSIAMATSMSELANA
jgi:hypothetical protein